MTHHHHHVSIPTPSFTHHHHSTNHHPPSSSHHHNNHRHHHHRQNNNNNQSPLNNLIPPPPAHNDNNNNHNRRNNQQQHQHYIPTSTSSSSSASIRGCCCCLLLLLSFLLLVILSVVLVIILAVKPKKPHFNLQQVSVQYINLATIPTTTLPTSASLSLAVRMLFTAENDNKVGIKYGVSTFNIMYRGIPLGRGTVPGFYQPAHSVREIQSMVTVDRVNLLQTDAVDLIKDASVNDRVELRIMGDVNAKIRILGLTSPSVQASVDCAIAISPTKRALTSKQCGFDGLQIHRDPDLWDKPNEFKPEIFEKKCDSKYKMLPFSDGRRGCPGTNLGYHVIGLALGTLIQAFEWEKIGNEEIDMTASYGFSMSRLEPLQALCKHRSNMIAHLL